MPQASQSLYESLGQNYGPDDLFSFEDKFNLYKINIDKVVGNNNADACYQDPDSCGEANLDVLYIMGMAQNAETWYWYSDDQSSTWTDWIYAVANDADSPLVHSISYGGYETDGDSEMMTFSTEAKKLALRGMTIIVSSGDDGVSNFNVRKGSDYCGYNPSFPATSPYVTTVGATQGPEQGYNEVACSSDTGGGITSGGGFSGYFKRPSYQDTAISYFFNNLQTKPYDGYQAEGRGIPDVSIMGHNYLISLGGQWTEVSGTSASSPVFAAMMTLVNDLRMQNGKGPMGFLNQVLYSLDSSVWNDITSGNNACSSGNQDTAVCCNEGFTAQAGWDPVTGLGTPKFDKLAEILIQL